jgi:hypothetical protein
MAQLLQRLFFSMRLSGQASYQQTTEFLGEEIVHWEML